MGASMMSGALVARLSPVELKTSQEIRLQRIAKTAVYKQRDGILIYPIPPRLPAIDALLAFLGDLYP
jgi:hypothetical protein